MRISQTIKSMTVALAVAGLAITPVDAGFCGCYVNMPVYSNIFRTTLCNPAPQYTWNGGVAPPADQNFVRGQTITVCGSIVYLIPQTSGNIPTHARAWLRVGGSYTYSAIVPLTNERTVRAASFGVDRADAKDFSISFPIYSGMQSGWGYFYVEYFNNGIYNGTASGGTAAGATPGNPAGHNLLQAYVP